MPGEFKENALPSGGTNDEESQIKLTESHKWRFVSSRRRIKRAINKSLQFLQSIISRSSQRIIVNLMRYFF